MAPMERNPTGERSGRDLPSPHDRSYPDRLDFTLSAEYNNADETNAPKARVVTQYESDKLKIRRYLISFSGQVCNKWSEKRFLAQKSQRTRLEIL